MRCSTAHREISAYLDGELTAQEKAAIASHLEHCSACREALQQLKAVQQLCRRTERVPAPAGLQRRVMANLDSKAVNRIPFARLVHSLAEGAAVLAVIGLGVLFGGFLNDALGRHGMVEGRSSLSLEVFDAAPPGSLGGAYLAMMEERP